MRFASFAAPAALALLAVAAPLQAQYAASTPVVEDDIVEVAAAAGTFTTLLAAAEAAGLVDVLKSEGPFTVFAPTDEAFAALPEGTVESLLANPEALRAILLYHVVPGKVMAAQVVGLNEAATAQGAMVSISTYGETVRVNDATVIAADIEASNGVIHVIDTVILPPSAN
jgi:transforming growth factor-beta-induced protein